MTLTPENTCNRKIKDKIDSNCILNPITKKIIHIKQDNNFNMLANPLISLYQQEGSYSYADAYSYSGAMGNGNVWEIYPGDGDIATHLNICPYGNQYEGVNQYNYYGALKVIGYGTSKFHDDSLSLDKVYNNGGWVLMIYQNNKDRKVNIRLDTKEKTYYNETYTGSSSDEMIRHEQLLIKAYRDDDGVTCILCSVPGSYFENGKTLDLNIATDDSLSPRIWGLHTSLNPQWQGQYFSKSTLYLDLGKNGYQDYSPSWNSN